MNAISQFFFRSCVLGLIVLSIGIICKSVVWSERGGVQSLYLISAYPSDLNSDYTMPVQLFELEGLALTMHWRGEIFSQFSGSRIVRIDYDSDIVVVGDAAAWYVPSRIEQALYRYRTFAMTKPWRLLSEFGPVDEQGAFQEYLLNPPDEDPIWALQIFDGTAYALHGWRIHSGDKLERLEWSSLRHWRCHGVPALGIQGFDNTDLAARNDGTLLIKARRPHEWPETDWTAPEGVDWKETDRIFPFVINDKMVVVAAVNERVHRSNGTGKAPFYFLDRTRNTWHRRVFKGGGSAVRGFDEWVGGYVAERKARREPPKIAGRAEWEELDRKRQKAGLRKISLRYEWWEQDAPGILFAYHAPTRRYFEFATNQGDSEVLLIDKNETIYFRVFDKLYRGRLAEGTFVEVRLVAEDDRIVDVHWMFRGEPWPEEFENRKWTDKSPPEALNSN